MARADRYNHDVTVAAARHSSLAHAVRELEVTLRRAAWASSWVDYQTHWTTKPHYRISEQTERLFKASDSAGAKRRRIMKGPSDKECEDGQETTT